MKQSYDLANLDWTLAGFIPFMWQLSPLSDIRTAANAEIPAIPACVPGSVQSALLSAGIIPDWNLGLNARLCEWVENRHWIFQAALPDAWTAIQTSERIQLHCLGLDDRGWVLLNGQQIGSFNGTFTPHCFDLTHAILPTGNLLQIVFDLPPRWLGQSGYTSQMTDWKPRYYYTWDWTSRVVQIGIWDTLSLVISDGAAIQQLKCTADARISDQTGILRASGRVAGVENGGVELALKFESEILRSERLSAADFNANGICWEGLPVRLWQPNGTGSPEDGAQPLYTLSCRLVTASGALVDEELRTVGFKHVTWQACEGAPDGADPWICVVNGQPLFLQGVNWTPIRPNFADVAEKDYRALVELYRDLGCNLLRVWGGAFLEKEIFYQLCDEYGLLVWQEFPLSSSGIDNWPPEDEASIAVLSAIAASYIARRQHHAALLCWCGGNELQGALDGGKQGIGKPVDLSHPLIRRFAEIVQANDPDRRFLPTSSSGPRFSVNPLEIGQGVHWDVHGPWKMDGTLAEWAELWAKDDGLFHSEVGAPGASPVDIISGYSGGLPALPASNDNPLWHRTSWWIEWPEFVAEMGRDPGDLPEFVAWSQQRQARALEIVARALKSRFPRCGGVIFWMGHDSFPCTANTSIIDFYGRPKPAALAIRQVFSLKK
jgi:beta-mannosidase